MDDDARADEAAAPTAAQIGHALAQIEASASFRQARRHRHLLRHLVERTIAGDQASLKETVIAVEVFGRPASRSEPRDDSIVRVETRRLRLRLDRFYRNEGHGLPVRIELPVGSYVPRLALRTAAPQAHAASRRARDLVERGQHVLRQPLSKATLEAALSRFDAALRESPDCVPALVGAARAWLNLGTGWYHAPAPCGEHAAEALQRALELDPRDAEAHVLLGAILHGFARDWTAAQRHFRRALALAPERAFVRSAHGAHLLYRGHFDEAAEHLAAARALDPQYVNTRIHLVNLRLAQGRLDDAQLELDAMIDIAPDSMPAAGLAGLIAMECGDAAAAERHLRRAMALAPGHANAIAQVAAACGLAGRVDEADALMAGIEADPAASPLSPYVRAVVATRCGRHDSALAHLESALDAGDPSVVMGPHDPSFRALHAQPTWPAWVQRVRQPQR